MLNLQERKNNSLQMDISEAWINEIYTLSLEGKSNNVKMSTPLQSN